ncbi:SCP2 domain-containing protein [Agrobacterium vitis]|uniref:ubiquinone anaerobic biosynthesis accessory factor UbiT n=1 Tax=Rhizobium/Agrobacterium group TaxID=227290 RepID=UPI0012E7B8C1|nr:MULTISPECIES: SCP2 sterol-binding domain-containing protein [Rhizobium/Agrobacterium group]MCF1494471.1 SCP2 domain-containing protein [Allorhizobium ampelinum]MVA45977.1 SCP2 domain-containing protein [Agrobacterium vitis]
MRIPPAMAAPLNFLPLFVIQRAVNLVFAQVMSRHPALLDRLGEHAAKRYGFSPADLPLSFVVEPSRPAIIVTRAMLPAETDAAIEGPLYLLLALLEGKYDADALFFSRDLSVTGDMEAMLALRNALDDCDIDLPLDLGAMAGPFGPLVTRAAGYVRQRALAEEAPAWN